MTYTNHESCPTSKHQQPAAKPHYAASSKTPKTFFDRDLEIQRGLIFYGILRFDLENAAFFWEEKNEQQQTPRITLFIREVW